jgi:hypothetical protein
MLKAQHDHVNPEIQQTGVIDLDVDLAVHILPIVVVDLKLGGPDI